MPGKAAGQQTFPAPSEKGWALSATVSERVRLIVSELVTNAVVHAHGKLQLRLALLDRQVRADVHDQTPHCDFPRSGPQSKDSPPTSLASLPPEAPSRPAERYGAALPPGGRGWSAGWPGLAAAAHELGTPRGLKGGVVRSRVGLDSRTAFRVDGPCARSTSRTPGPGASSQGRKCPGQSLGRRRVGQQGSSRQTAPPTQIRPPSDARARRPGPLRRH